MMVRMLEVAGIVSRRAGSALLVRLPSGEELRAVGTAADRPRRRPEVGERVLVRLPRSRFTAGRIVRLAGPIDGASGAAQRVLV